MPLLLLSQAYRPLFPLAALYAAGGILFWLSGLSGMLELPAHPTLWHAHEMLFGFAGAVIAGFVLTAVVNWTGRPSVTPGVLAILVLLWLAARLAGFLPQAPAQSLAAVCDSLFLPAVALLMTRVLLGTRNRRNYMFIPFLWSLALVNIGFHWSLAAGRPDLARLLISLTVYLIGFLMVFMGGRVIPFFSARRCQYTPIQTPWLNWTSTLGALLAGILLVFLPHTAWAAVAAAVAGMATVARLLLWQTGRLWAVPMLWILHLGYAWLAVAYLLAAAVQLEWLPSPTLPVHALMAGGLGCLSLGMMTRVALGHSGRPIEASPVMIAAFVLVVAAGIMRLAGYLPWSGAGLPSLTISAVLWFLAFSLYALRFISLLWRAR